MKATESALDQTCLAMAKKDIELYGDRIPEQTQKAILEQRVALGMSPYEAKLAGGAFQYRVEMDAKYWPAKSDPLQVMWAQSVRPDDSKIWMTFETGTQFPEQGRTKFTVYFEKGKAVQIDNQGGP